MKFYVFDPAIKGRLKFIGKLIKNFLNILLSKMGKSFNTSKRFCRMVYLRDMPL